ncbi:MAG: DegT/DnrJ/EryC1/StrS family aminotransferase [Marinifilaceae bacterium]
MLKVSMVDLHGQYLKIKDQIDQAIQEVINSTAFINGPQVDLFVEELASWLGVKYVIPCGSGTDALQIALMSLDLSPGDEVAVPVHTYAASAEVIALLKLKPVFVDVDPLTFTIDVKQFEEKLTSRTKAVIPVHLFGQCANMEALGKLAQRYNLKIVEDTAQALGAKYKYSDGSQVYAGTMGDFGTTSFFPTKNLGCFGDGGALFTNDDLLAKKAKMIANHGQSKKYYHEIIGCNSRLDSIQAAILRVKLQHLNDYNSIRREIASFYDKAFLQIPAVKIPVRADYSTHIFNQYTILVHGRKSSVSLRDQLRSRLLQAGIPSVVYYPKPLHLQNAYCINGYGVGSFPVAERLCEIGLSLPIHTEMREEQLNYIVTAVNQNLVELAGKEAN